MKKFQQQLLSLKLMKESRFTFSCSMWKYQLGNVPTLKLNWALAEVSSLEKHKRKLWMNEQANHDYRRIHCCRHHFVLANVEYLPEVQLCVLCDLKQNMRNEIKFTLNYFCVLNGIIRRDTPWSHRLASPNCFRG